ncbi:aromatic ring-hydroxylating oxygenase subunit alpha [Zavarzinella formosa]|uniref:aromatic ring-hydroxylating oxygenase subunit alpha n=1 Tax=Zavarzinella formosa TaxID=360055 RepID=UPI00031D2922|nr:SRPBCC family protein [Zavarzinella formosa]
MFVHQQHLRHLLRPDQYYSAEQHQAELRHLLHPAWHPVAIKADLAKPGDFLTLQLLDTPLLLRNMDGELTAFLNVCPHRHSKLTDQARGSSPKLKCQYHGWEFDRDGRTGKIPDARAFRPWDRENSCLRKFRVDTCGEVVFVCLSDETPALRDWAAPFWELWNEGFGGDYEFSAAWEIDFSCNWKVILENSLESYHIPQVHPKTFKVFPEETNAWHELNPRFSSFRTIPPSEVAIRIQNWIIRRLGGRITHEYWHRVLHPHLTFSTMDSTRLIQCVLPTSPTTCRYRSMLFTLRGSRRNPLAYALYRFLKMTATFVAKKVVNEDGVIYEGVQRGLEASPHPGVIGTREERIFVFQEYVRNACKGPKALTVLEDHQVPDVANPVH